ncbi:unnamed protein product [Calypogeia fissa]
MTIYWFFDLNTRPISHIRLIGVLLGIRSGTRLLDFVCRIESRDTNAANFNELPWEQDQQFLAGLVLPPDISIFCLLTPANSRTSKGTNPRRNNGLLSWEFASGHNTTFSCTNMAPPNQVMHMVDNLHM